MVRSQLLVEKDLLLTIDVASGLAEAVAPLRALVFLLLVTEQLLLLDARVLAKHGVHRSAASVMDCVRPHVVLVLTIHVVIVVSVSSVHGLMAAHGPTALLCMARHRHTRAAPGSHSLVTSSFGFLQPTISG